MSLSKNRKFIRAVIPALNICLRRHSTQIHIWQAPVLSCMVASAPSIRHYLEGRAHPVKPAYHACFMTEWSAIRLSLCYHG